MNKIIILAAIATIIFGGCSMRILTFGEEASKIDRTYTVGVSTKEGVENVQE